MGCTLLLDILGAETAWLLRTAGRSALTNDLMVKMCKSERWRATKVGSRFRWWCRHTRLNNAFYTVPGGTDDTMLGAFPGLSRTYTSKDRAKELSRGYLRYRWRAAPHTAPLPMMQEATGPCDCALARCSAKLR
jgi:hypothetical protein